MARTSGRKGSLWRRLSAQVRARRDPCYICRQPIDYTIADHNHPDAFTVDHRKSWANHPELRTDPGNLVAAHRRCNASKGQGETKHDLGMQSRQW